MFLLTFLLESSEKETWEHVQVWSFQQTGSESLKGPSVYNFKWLELLKEAEEDFIERRVCDEQGNPSVHHAEETRFSTNERGLKGDLHQSEEQIVVKNNSDNVKIKEVATQKITLWL